MTKAMAYGTNTSGNAGQVAIDRFAEMMIARMEQMKASDWKKGWIGGASGFAGLPQNVGGRNYSGSNSFFLQLQTAAQGYRLPVYLTFKQAHNLKAHVLKGEKAFPVVYWDVLVKDKNGHKVSSDEYKAMSKEEKKGMDVIPFFKAFPVYNIDQTNVLKGEKAFPVVYWDVLVKDKNGHKVSSDEYKAMSKEEKKGMDVIPFFKAFPVYNIDQTNLAEVQPERVQKLMEKFKVPELRDKEGMYVHAALDRMIETQGWLCPIQADKRVDGAFYSPAQDIVVLPMKEQFNIGNTPEEVYRGGMEFYSTMLHEMSHSTMTPERLNREMGGRFGDPKYAKEELVAELTAAMICHSMGFDMKVTDNSAAYLDSWIGVLKQEPNTPRRNWWRN